MTDVHIKRVLRNIDTLARNMKVEDIQLQLVAAEILSDEDWASIVVKGTSKQKTEHFLMNIFLTKADWAFDELVKVLNNNGKKHIADILVRDVRE